ncbi:hypothetical protein [Sorangium sp. So ce1182]|uniref:hypothetical protein n=1 Tax=Sorangium sp. So ce1182 TaxID=3133334 RepID=UPI003F62AF20
MTSVLRAELEETGKPEVGDRVSAIAPEEDPIRTEGAVDERELMSTHETTADVDQHLEIRRPEVVSARGVEERDRIAEHRRRCPCNVAVHPSVEHGDDLRDLACEALQARDLLSEQARIEARALADVQPDQSPRVADLPREEVTEQAALLVE